MSKPERRQKLLKRVRNNLYDELDLLENQKYTLIHYIGSMETGLVSDSSDIDFIVELMDDGIVPTLHRLTKVLRHRRSKFTVDRTLPHIRVPLIKTVHKDTGIKVDISFMCPSMPREFAIQNTKLIRTYAENDRQMKLAIVFLKHLLGHKPSGSAQTQGISSYGWTILMFQYCIIEKRLFVKPNNFEINVVDQEKTAGQILMGFLEYIRTKLPWENVDIVENTPPTEQHGEPRIPTIRDPYERQRNLGMYLNDTTWDRLLDDVEYIQTELSKCPHTIYNRTCQERKQLTKTPRPKTRSSLRVARPTILLG